MARRDLSRDSTSHAAGELDYILKQTAKSSGEASVPTVTAEQAMKEVRLVQHQSQRDITRVLFISQDPELLNPTQQSLDGYLDISDVFDEVHILILRHGINPTQVVLRPHKNVWIYTAASSRWWLMHKRGQELLQEQLVFAEGFRPDLVVARDPFESALVALWVHKKFRTPIQLHVLLNFYAASFSKLSSGNWLRRLLARYTIPKFLSIRTATQRVQHLLIDRFDVADIKRLPQLNAYESIASVRQTLDLKAKYPQYVFNILFVGNLTNSSKAAQAIDAARFMLLNKRIGMIVLGDGPAYRDCQKRAKLLGVEKQLVFERRSRDRVQYLKAANLLIVTDTDPQSEELVLQAAGAQIPMVMTWTEAREDMFTHLESAYICPPDDVQALADGIHELMNNYAVRKQITDQAFAAITERFHQDPEEYRRDYRDSIEQALFVGEEPESASAA
jgi:glycosyltransferase involved in cell wall biosynthesis